MYLGIDIGGTKTLLAVLDESGNITEQIKFPTPQDYDQFITDTGENIGKLSTKEFTAVAAGIPGLLDRQSGIVRALGNLPWRDKPIRDSLARFVSSPITVENDAKAAALAEATSVLDHYRRVLYLTVSTGIGGGFVMDGQLEPNLQDCEVGHMIFEHDGQLKLWEKFASGKAIVEKYGKRASELDDPTAWEAVAANIGLGVIACCSVAQVEAIIFGGGVGTHFEKFQAPLQQFIDVNTSPLIHKPALLPAQHAELAVIYGCYQLASHAHGPSAQQA